MPRIKMVVWDADNTLWDGSVFYKDKENVKLKPGTPEALKELSKWGIRNSICSRNYYDDVDYALKKFEIDKYFEHPQIGWGRKSEAIQRLSQLTNIPVGEMLFIDDDGFQRAEVQAMIPQINVLFFEDPLDVLSVEGIKPEQATEEDSKRVVLLKQQRNRKQAEESHQGDFSDFLSGCNMVMTVRPVKESDWERVCQLLNRTNELNATMNRYTLEELKESYTKNKDIVYIVELDDKFGEYGLIAECIIDTTVSGVWQIKDLTVSCRTMGRGIGSALLICVMHYAKEHGVKKIEGILREIESNWRMKPLYVKRGFTVIKSEGNQTTYGYTLKDGEQLPSYHPWLTVNRK